MAFIFLKRYWKPLLGMNIFLLVATIASYVLMPRVWVASAQLIMPNATASQDIDLGELGILKDSGITFTTALNPLKIQTSILMSNHVLQRVFETDPEREEFEKLSAYQKLFRAKPEDLSTNITIEVRGSSPEIATTRAASLIRVYQQRMDELRRNSGMNRDNFIQDHFIKASNELSITHANLAQFQKSTGVVNVDEQIKSLVVTIDSLKSTQVQALSEFKASTGREQLLRQQVGMISRKALDSLRLSENKEYQSTRAKLSEVDTELANARGFFTDNSPQIQSLLLQRQELKDALQRNFRSVISNPQGVNKDFGGNNFKDAQAELILKLTEAEAESYGLENQSRQLQGQIDKLDERLRAYSTQQAKLLELKRKYDIAEGVYKGIVAQAQQAKVNAFDYYPNMQVLDEPTVPQKPDSPKGSLIALGGLLAALSGSIALVLFLESRNPLLKPKDLEEIELPILGQIPQLERLAPKDFMTEGIEVEFQRLASAISLMSLDNHRLMVSSASSGEGKTSVTLSLALALADLGFRVLLVDGDFRLASLSDRLGWRPSASTVEVCSTPVHLDYPRLDLLPTFPRSDSKAIVEWIAQGHFDRDLTVLQESNNYDYVIVDSAPSSLTSETALMATAIKNVLLVVRWGVSDRHKVHESLAHFQRHHAHIIGLALNGVEETPEVYSYRNEKLQLSQ
jgi:polysaccharide biosynthesis transport protein